MSKRALKHNKGSNYHCWCGQSAWYLDQIQQLRQYCWLVYLVFLIKLHEVLFAGKMVAHRCQGFRSGCNVIYWGKSSNQHIIQQNGRNPTIWFPWSRLYSSIVWCWISFGSCRRSRRGEILRVLHCIRNTDIIGTTIYLYHLFFTLRIYAWNEVKEDMSMVVLSTCYPTSMAMFYGFTERRRQWGTNPSRIGIGFS